MFTPILLFFIGCKIFFRWSEWHSFFPYYMFNSFFCGVGDSSFLKLSKHVTDINYIKILTCCQLFQTLILLLCLQYVSRSICLYFLVWHSWHFLYCQLSEPFHGLLAVLIFLKCIINSQQTTFARLVSVWVFLLFCSHPLPHYYIKVWKLFLPTLYISVRTDGSPFFSCSLLSFNE